MSWQLGIAAMLAVMLVAGAVWYERSRPPSQVVALVAALAALAVAGRIALSPVPNVLPSTDIVLIAGYALGGAPGFAVGALTALVSNFWLGQGPWTPWQMAGWGASGVGGAALAAATGRGLGRWGLAFACAAAGLAYGAMLDLSLMVTYGGEQSLDRYLALSVRGIPFNLAHAAGNFAFALIAGPALARMLIRYRERFEFAWGTGRTRGAVRVAGLALIAAAIASAVVTGLRSDPATARGPADAAAYLREAQNDDGGFSATPGSPSSLGMTGWASLGLEAAGVNPRDVGSPSPIAYLRREGRSLRDTGDLERTILALEGAGLNPRRFGGQDLVAKLKRARGRDGSWAGQVNLTAFGIFALAAAGEGGNGRSANWLAKARAEDGGWAFVADADTGDADSTGAALQALAAAGGNRGAIATGVRWLRREQQPGGGFELAGGGVNAQSTAWAVQGLIAAGVDPGTVRRGGRSGLDYLASVQAADGHYRYSRTTDQTPVWVTAQAVMAVNRRSFPLAAVPAQGEGAKGAKTGGVAVGDAAAPKDGSGGVTAPRSAAPKAAAGATAGVAAESEPAPPDAALTPAAAGDEDDDGGSPWLLLGIAAAVAAAIWGGWIAYRRRLPAR